MRRTTMSTSRLCRGLAVATIAAAFSGLLGIPAHAAEPPPGQAVPPAIPTAEPDVGSTTIPAATQREKYDAVNAIHVGEPTDDWLRLSDKNFVFRIYDKISIDKFPRTKAEASRVYGLTVPDASVFIRTGVHEFVQRDQDEQVLRDAEKQHRVTTRMKAIENAHIAPDPAMLDLTDRNFVFQVFSRATTGSKVKAGAATAYQGDAAVWKTFIEVTVLELAEQDDFAAIEKARQQSEEEAQRVERELKRRSAVAAIPATFQTVWLQAPDDVFIRELLRLPELAVPANIEIKDAADLASRSTDPAVWRTFVNTGLKEAADRGKARREREEDEANRRVVREIRTRAENGGVRPRLVAAADTALTGSRSDVVAFLREGQYQVLNQSLQTVTPGVKGWYVHSGGGDAWITPGQAGTDGTKPLPYATWKVANGLADPLCYSFESVDRTGNYLRQQDFRVKLHGNDGTDAFKRDATWCPKRTGWGIALESKAQPGRVLRHIDAQLWVAQLGGGNWFDTERLFNEDSGWKVVAPNPEVSTPLMLGWYNDDQLRALAGNPKAAEVHDAGVRYRDFQNGRVYWGPETGARFVTGEIHTRYLALGGHKWLLPLTHQVTGGGSAKISLQQGVAIYWTPATGAKLVMGAIRGKWDSLGAETGQLGFPTSDEYDIPGGRRSDFQNGWSISWNAADGELRVFRRVIVPVG